MSEQDSQRTVVSIYTDGACSGNPGPGGWGVVIRFEDTTVMELGGGAKDATNNQMELQAAIAGLEYLNGCAQSQPVRLFTDSKYAIDGINKWIKNWKKNGWQTQSKQPVKNKELWQTLDALNSARKVQWHWVQGHSGDPDNERCDEIARAYATGQTPPLRSPANGGGNIGQIAVKPQIKANFVVNASGDRIAALLDMAEYQQLLRELDELHAIRTRSHLSDD